MKETGQHIVNMFKTKRGEHCLFRQFGLNPSDSVGLMNKSTVQLEISKWYPAVKSISVSRTGGKAEKGESQYLVTVIEE